MLSGRDDVGSFVSPRYKVSGPMVANMCREGVRTGADHR